MFVCFSIYLAPFWYVFIKERRFGEVEECIREQNSNLTAYVEGNVIYKFLLEFIFGVFSIIFTSVCDASSMPFLLNLKAGFEYLFSMCFYLCPAQAGI
jgi:hypothetical protein